MYYTEYKNFAQFSHSYVDSEVEPKVHEQYDTSWLCKAFLKWSWCDIRPKLTSKANGF